MLGALLAGRPRGCWEDTLNRLCTAGQLATAGENLFEELRVSCDGLAPQEQQMFLDVACLMLGRSPDFAKSVWQR